MEIQELESNADFRIKFASINENGGFEDDALEEYEQIFASKTGHLTDEWKYAKVERMIETRFEHTRHAWRLVHQDGGIAAAVEHETGIEIILFGIASGVGTAAVIGLAKWGWRKWTEVRAPEKRASSLIAEKVIERSTNGSIRRIERVEIRGPLDHSTFDRAIDELFM